MTTYLLIFDRALNGNEQNRIMIASGATVCNVVTFSEPHISDLLELCSHAGYKVDRYRSFLLRITTNTPLTMLVMLGEIAPQLILECSNGFDDAIERTSDALNKYLDLDAYVAELSTNVEDYKSAFATAFNQQSDLPDTSIIYEIQDRVSEEQEILNEKIKGMIDTFRPKNNEDT